MPQVGAAERARAGRWFGARAVLAWIAVLLVAVPFATLVVLVRTKSAALATSDDDTARSLHGYALGHPAFTRAMKVISAIGGPTAWWIVLTPLFVWLLLRRRPRLAAFVAVTALGSALLNLAVKTIVDRARPHLVDPVAVAAGKSFPSGHAQAATVGFGILLLVLLPAVPRTRRIWVWLAAVAGVAAIGFARIALGVHYLSDVLGAVLIGSAWLLAMTAAFSPQSG